VETPVLSSPLVPPLISPPATTTISPPDSPPVNKPGIIQPHTTVVKTAVADTNFGYDRIFEYALPANVEALPGCRVLVPFGIGNRKRIALILDYGEREENVVYKNIFEAIDRFPVINAEGLMLIEWLTRMTFCTYFDACKLFLASGFNVKLKTRYRVNEELFREREALLSDSDVKACAMIRKTGLSDEQSIPFLLSEKLIYPEEYISGRRKPKTENIVTLSEKYRAGHLKYAFSGDKARKTVEFLKSSPGVSDKELQKLFDISSVSLKTLQKRGIIEIFPTETLYAADDIDEFSPTDYTLNASQQSAADGIYELMNTGKPSVSLLYGVTGSGKTVVFLDLLRRTLAAGKTAMLLVPEISLTPQLKRRFVRFFGSTVACLHSGLSVTKRAEELARIRSGNCKLVIGTRSAVFAPLENIGIIIIDEEQEHSYISEMTPRYDARMVAKKRCAYHNAALLLASATPSVESFHYAQSGKYNLFTLSERYSAAALPDVQIVDLAEEGFYGESQNLSPTLTEEINRNLENGEQTILLLNRRGFNTVITCRSCRQTVMCPHCSVALTYHKKEERLRCHWCGYNTDSVSACPSCGSEYLQFIGSGTQRIEQELRDYFPSARVLRMDADTVSSRGAYEECFAAFERGDADILLGTQMIAKGLDFPNVTLVGVISADGALFAGDYKSFERTFSLLTQVAGRGGRGSKPGRAVIQTFNPDHYIIRLAAAQDYISFFEQESGNRKLLLYPPFCDICAVEFTGTDDTKTMNAAASFGTLFRDTAAKRISELSVKIPAVILGPARCIRERVNNKFRYKLLIKCRFNNDFREVLRMAYTVTFTDRVYDRITVSLSMNGDAAL
jgi:primosomal protein N' (replication factor Y)